MITRSGWIMQKMGWVQKKLVLHNNLQLQWFLPKLIVCQKVYMFFQHLFDHTPLWCHCIHSEHPENSSSNSSTVVEVLQFGIYHIAAWDYRKSKHNKGQEEKNQKIPFLFFFFFFFLHNNKESDIGLQPAMTNREVTFFGCNLPGQQAGRLYCKHQLGEQLLASQHQTGTLWSRQSFPCLQW